jgi:hypothetical protein
MSQTQIPVATPAGITLFTDSAMNLVDAVKASSTLLYYVFIDNSANSGPCYVKLWNLAAGSVTLGTTVPDEVIFVPGLAEITMPIFAGAKPGKTFDTALSAACVITGGTAGVTAPTNPVTVTLAYV